MHTLYGYTPHILCGEKDKNIKYILEKNRPNARGSIFFEPKISDLHDPYLLGDMEVCVKRILEAQKHKERIIIFGDYDVDGVSSTAILVRFLKEIGCEVSYRLPHRVHDGYGLKEYFFDELREKNVTLVITVDCGTRDIGPIRYAKSLGIDVIVTDHHAVPDTIPEEVIGIINPKRKDSKYPFPDLAGAGVAFKLVHGILLTMNDEQGTMNDSKEMKTQNEENIYNTLQKYIDFASLGTVSDCMPIVGENRTITSLGLRQMQKSSSYGLRKFLEGREDSTEKNADIIGFQIGPRINAAGRMDTPLIALRWLLASDERCDVFFDELEHLNETRKKTTDEHFQEALENIDLSLPIIFYDAHNLEHGIIGLVAGKLTEIYGKPSIIIKNGHNHPLTRRKGDEINVDEGDPIIQSELSIASCRSPEWCNMIELLDSAKDIFVRYGGHRQAAGFTIEEDKIPELKTRLLKKFATLHDIHNLPKKIMNIECILNPAKDLTLENLDIIDTYRPFGIGNRKPLFLLQDETVSDTKNLGKEGKHLEVRLTSAPGIKLIAWGWGENGDIKRPIIVPGDIISFIVELDRNIWNNKASINVTIKDIII